MSKNFLKISNTDGKVWLIPKHNIRVALELYQPSSSKGKFLKKLLPWVFWLNCLMNKVGIKEIKYNINVTLYEKLCKIFDKEVLECSVFEGTPSVHKKTTIQIFNNKKILGYCKLTQSSELYKIFEHERDLLKWLSLKGVTQIPKCIYCGEIHPGLFAFIQTTIKTTNSSVDHKLGERQINFLRILKEKTKIICTYHETNQYQNIIRLQNSIHWLEYKQQKIIEKAINIIEEHYKNNNAEFSAYHADFTPWNMFVEKDKLFVFDFEYGEHTYIPFLDIFHFLTQSAIFERHLKAQQIYTEMISRMWWLRKYFDNPEIAYLVYLIDTIARYVVRDEDKRTSDDNLLINTWISIIQLLISDKLN